MSEFSACSETDDFSPFFILTEMALLCAKFHLDELLLGLTSLHVYKFAVLDQISICVRLSGELSDTLFSMRSPVRVRVRELLMQNCKTLRCLKILFKTLHARITEVKEKVKYVRNWIGRHEHFQNL